MSGGTKELAWVGSVYDELPPSAIVHNKAGTILTYTPHTLYLDKS